MNAHPLDRPVWTALATRHRDLSLGTERARRYAPDIGPFVAACDDDAASLAELASLVPEHETVLLLQADAIAVPPSTRTTTTAEGVQMVLATLADVAPDPRIVPLGPDDWPAMRALAALTRPGPFAARTPVLGEFFGVKHEGALVAMAGERMKQPGYTEVSGVCTHPDARGRGYARSLSAHVARRILARGETPYLHAYATNAPAITLYEALGFRLRCTVNVASLARA